MDDCWPMKVLLCVVSSCVLAEFLGLLASSSAPQWQDARTESRHMRHHLLLYGPKQNQRPSEPYMDATVGRVALGNIGLEWLVRSGLVLGASLGLFWLLGVRVMYQAIYVGLALGWSFVTFNYLHDRMHVKGFWMERNRWTKSWF